MRTTPVFQTIAAGLLLSLTSTAGLQAQDYAAWFQPAATAPSGSNASGPAVTQGPTVKNYAYSNSARYAMQPSPQARVGRPGASTTRPHSSPSTNGNFFMPFSKSGTYVAQQPPSPGASPMTSEPDAQTYTHADSGYYAAPIGGDCCLTGGCAGGCNFGACGGCCGSMSGNCYGKGCGGGHRGNFIVGGEVLFVRPVFSNDAALISRELNGAMQTDRIVEFDWDHEEQWRGFIGWRICCDTEIRLTVTDFGDESERACEVGGNVTGCAGFLEIKTTTNGDVITSFASVDATTYDIEFSKTIYLGSGKDCCDPCCYECPPWELTWYGGIRIADVDWRAGSERRDDGGDLEDLGIINMDFIGVGPRVGIEGRRYFRCHTHMSVYARGYITALIGDHEFEAVRADLNDLTQVFNQTRVIPVIDVECGITWHLSKQARITGGYLIQAYHDLGIEQEILGFTQFGAPDDANILAFDGGFLRAEIGF